MSIKNIFKKTAGGIKKAAVTAATFVAAVFLYVFEHVYEFIKKNSKRFYKYIATLTQKHIIKIFLFSALAIIVITAAVIVIAQTVPKNGTAQAIKSAPENPDADGFATVCIGGILNCDGKTAGTDIAGYLAPLSDVFNADINMVFAGTGITTDGGQLEAIKSCGVDLLSVATRYCVLQAQTVADAEQINCIGTQSVPSYLTSVGGISVGIVAAYGYQSEGSQAFCFDCMSDSGAAPVSREISLLRSKGAQFIIAAVDWGASTAPEPSDIMHETASQLCADGADMVIGTGSLYIQSARIIGEDETAAPDLDGQSLVAYSIGHLTSDRIGEGLSHGSYAARITLVRHSDSEKAFAKPVEYVPVYRYKKGAGSSIFPATYDNNQNAAKLLTPEEYKRYTAFSSALQDKLGELMSPVFDEQQNYHNENITL